MLWRLAAALAAILAAAAGAAAGTVGESASAQDWYVAWGVPESALVPGEVLEAAHPVSGDAAAASAAATPSHRASSSSAAPQLFETRAWRVLRAEEGAKAGLQALLEREADLRRVAAGASGLVRLSAQQQQQQQQQPSSAAAAAAAAPPHALTRPVRRVVPLAEVRTRAQLLAASERRGADATLLESQQLASQQQQRRQAAVPPAEWNAQVAAAVASVDGARWNSDIATVASYNRYFGPSLAGGGSPSFVAATDWLAGELSSALAPAGSALIPVERLYPVNAVRDPSFNSTYFNIVGGIRGTVSPERYIVVGAHMDATSQSPTAASPGAEDNGSGSVGLLAVARALAPRCAGSLPVTGPGASLCRVTILFALFTAEEIGLHGSRAFVNGRGESDLRSNLVVAHTTDMAGYMPAGQTTPRVTIESYPRHQSFVLPYFQRAAAAYAQSGLQVDWSGSPFGSDHMPFLDLGGTDSGVPAVLLIQSWWASYADYHRTTDTANKLSQVLALDIIRMNIAAIADFAYQDTASSLATTAVSSAAPTSTTGMSTTTITTTTAVTPSSTTGSAATTTTIASTGSSPPPASPSSPTPSPPPPSVPQPPSPPGITVPGGSPDVGSDSGLPAGVIVTIVLVSLVAFGALAGLIVYAMSRPRGHASGALATYNHLQPLDGGGEFSSSSGELSFDAEGSGDSALDLSDGDLGGADT